MRHGILALVVAACCFGSAATAQNYKFSIPSAEVTVTIEPNGVAMIFYKLTFECSLWGHRIDVVDIGMPNLAAHTPGGAAINGHTLPPQRVQISSYLKPFGSGYEIQLADKSIAPGQRGVFQFAASENAMVWQDVTDPDQASFRFSPTWFGKEFVTGQTRLTLRFILPIPKTEYPAVKDRILWQKEGQEFNAKGVLENENNVSVAWVRNVSLTGPNEFGVSFPKRFVASVREDSLAALVYRWFRGNTKVRVGGGIVALLLFAVAFFPFTGGTGWSTYLFLCAVLTALMYKSPAMHLALFPLFAGMGISVLLWRLFRKKRYFPAQFCREGGGIGRGLDSVEAAVLLEMPLHQILTMIIFGMMKKGIINIRSKEPLKVELVGSALGARLWKTGDTSPLRLAFYEPLFLRAFHDQGDKPIEEMDLHKPFDLLIRRVAKAMDGFDAEATREYYRAMVNRAWEQVFAESGFEARSRRVDGALGWLMLDRQWDQKIKKLDDKESYNPDWWIWPRVYHGPRGASPRTHGDMPAAPSAVSAPDASFADVAHAFSARFENLCNTVFGQLPSVKATPTGAVDLSGIDTFTTDTLTSMLEGAQSSGSHGGGGGGCACACAGCACACACAGGGR